jgi:hypothetical protein
VNNAQRQKAVYALRVVAEALQRELVVDRPTGVVIYGRNLAPCELRWLVEGMQMRDVQPLDLSGPKGEDREIVGYILGRAYRVHVKHQRLAELNDVLRAPAGAS